MMKFAIAQEIDLEASKKEHIIEKVSNLIKSFLSNKDYGDDLQHFYIGCICIKTPPGYEEWFKIRRPRYKAKTTVKKLDGSKIELYGVFSYDIKPDYERFVYSSDEESERILAEEILKSLSHFDRLSKRVKNFDAKRFKRDLEHFLKTTFNLD